MAETNTLKEEILQRIDRKDNKLAIATSVIEAVKKGDKSALSLISTLLDERAKHDEDKIFPLTDAKLEEVICLCADRIRGARTF